MDEEGLIKRSSMCGFGRLSWRLDLIHHESMTELPHLERKGAQPKLRHTDNVRRRQAGCSDFEVQSNCITLFAQDANQALDPELVESRVRTSRHKRLR